MVHTNGNGHSPSIIDFPATIPDRLEPHDVEAEEAVIGSILIDPDCILKLSPVLDSADFFIHRLGWIYAAMKSLFSRNCPANDMLLIVDELKRLGRDINDFGGIAGLTELITVTPSSIHAEHYAAIVAEQATRRRVIAAAGEMARLAHNSEVQADELIAKSEKMLLDIGRTDNKEAKFAGELIDQVSSRIDRVIQAGGITGLPSGLNDLDLLIGGFQAGDDIVIAGRPGMGKSAMAMQIAKYNAKLDRRVLVFSLEMSDEQLMQRMIASETGIEVHRLRTGKIADSEWPHFSHATNMIAGLPLAIVDNATLTPSQMRSLAIRHHAKFGLDLLILDYLQLMSMDGRNQNRTQDVSDISRAVKKLARELKVPFIVLSQLNRGVEARADKRPMLADLRDSGSIEADADIVIFLYRDEVYNADTEFPGVAEVIVSKHRSGPTGMLSVFFKKHQTEFVNLEVRRQPLEYVP